MNKAAQALGRLGGRVTSEANGEEVWTHAGWMASVGMVEGGAEL